MPGRTLLDTSAAAALLRGDPTIADTLDDLEVAHTSVVVIGELVYGARLSANSDANLERVAAFAAAVTVLPVDRGTSEVYARIKESLREKGRPIPDNDLWIASTAVRLDLGGAQPWPLRQRDAGRRTAAGTIDTLTAFDRRAWAFHPLSGVNRDVAPRRHRRVAILRAERVQSTRSFRDTPRRSDSPRPGGRASGSAVGRVDVTRRTFGVALG